MKINNNTLLLIGGLVVLYVILRKQEPKKTGKGCYRKGMILGDNGECISECPSGYLKAPRTSNTMGMYGPERPFDCVDKSKIEERPIYTPIPVYDSEGNIIGHTRDGLAQPLN